MTRKVLCIGPSAALCAALKDMPGEAGWEVLCCPDIDSIPQISGVWVAVVTAAVLPSGDYRSVLQHFKGRNWHGEPPILLLTAGEDRAAADTALARGITEVFSEDDPGALRSYFTVLAGYPLQRPSGGRVLILDDDLVIGLYLEKVLADSGMVVERVGDLPAALAAVAAKRYDLIVADIVLGVGQSGNHFIRMFRQMPAMQPRTPVIAMSGFEDEARRLDALRAGADAFLTKPLNETEFMLTVHHLLGGGLVAHPGTGGGHPSESRFELSRRESVICSLAVAGHSDKRIAEQLNISFWTVRAHLASIFRKCGVNNRIDLARRLNGQELRPGANSHGLAPYLLENFHLAVIVTDRQRRIVYVNQAFSHITGYTAEEVLGQTPAVLHSGKYYAEFYLEIMQRLGNAAGWAGEIWNRKKDGSLFLAWLDIRQLPSAAPLGARYVGVLSDLTGRQLELDRVRHYALHDALTGLGNRTMLENRWSYEMARSRRNGTGMGVLFIDLDRFKAVNDSLGHENGDRLLVIVAARIRGCFRNNDTVVRYGGDEFLVLLPDIADRADAAALARKTLDAVCAAFELDGEEFEIGASIGIALFPEHGKELDTLISRADAAMYRAKEEGGNRFCFFDDEKGKQVGVPERLQAALSSGGLRLRFQPRLDLASLKMVGAATLLQLGDETAVDIAPAHASGAGERNGRSADLFNWMLQQVCTLLQRLHASGPAGFAIALRVPTVQLMRRSFRNEVATVMTHCGVSPQQLVFQVSEHSWVREPVRVREALCQLDEMGIGLSLEGFGVGQSRLELVRELPLDFLEFDRKLVNATPHDRYSTSVLASLVHLATGLGLKTVAEGVDQETQFAWLRDCGCHHAQGALFGEPLPEAGLLDALTCDQVFAAPSALQ